MIVFDRNTAATTLYYSPCTVGGMEHWPLTGDRYDPYDPAHPMWGDPFWGRYTAGPAAGPAAPAPPPAPPEPERPAGAGPDPS